MSDRAIGVSLLREARDAGLIVALDGDTVRLRASAEPPQVLVQSLRRHKDALVRALRSEHCGIGAARPPERTCHSCGGGLQPDDDDLSLCSACRWYADRFAPRRMQ